MFKRIEFDVDVEVIKAEIQVREAIINALGHEGQADNMTSRFCLVPILAVVIGNRRPWKLDTVAGFLTPYSGQGLEILARETGKLVLSVSQLRACFVASGSYQRSGYSMVTSGIGTRYFSQRVTGQESCFSLMLVLRHRATNRIAGHWASCCSGVLRMYGRCRRPGL